MLATDGLEHAGGSPVKEANVLTEHAAAEPLAVDPAAHFNVHDSGSAVLITAAATAVNMRSTHTHTHKGKSAGMDRK